MFFYVTVVLLMLFKKISLFIISPKNSAEMLSNVPKCKKVMTCLAEKTKVLEKFHSGMSCSAAGHEFNVNESVFMK